MCTIFFTVYKEVFKMDMGTINILNNFKFVFGGGIELEEMIKKMLKEENVQSSVRKGDSPFKLQPSNISRGGTSSQTLTSQMKISEDKRMTTKPKPQPPITPTTTKTKTPTKTLKTTELTTDTTTQTKTPTTEASTSTTTEPITPTTHVINTFSDDIKSKSKTEGTFKHGSINKSSVNCTAVDPDSSNIGTHNQDPHQQKSNIVSGSQTSSNIASGPTTTHRHRSKIPVINETPCGRLFCDQCPLCGSECSVTDMTHSQLPVAANSQTSLYSLTPPSKHIKLSPQSNLRCQNCNLNNAGPTSSQVSSSLTNSQVKLHKHFREQRQSNKLHSPLDTCTVRPYVSRKRQMLATSKNEEVLLSVDGDVHKTKMTRTERGKGTRATRGLEQPGYQECCLKEAEFELPQLNVFENVSPEIGYLDISEMNYIRAELMKGQACFVDLPPGKCVDDIRNEQERFFEEKSTCRLHEGPMRQHIQIKVMQVLTRYFENKITEIVRFAKFIPGFRNLPLDDQATLVKESKVESEFLGGMEGLNTENFVFSTPDNQHYTIEEFRTMFPEELLQAPLQFLAKSRQLDLRVEERAVLRAISITFTDRKELSCPGEVQALHNKLVTCLLHVIQEYHPRPSIRLGQLVNLLTELRQTTDMHLQHFKNILLRLPEYSESHMLVTEFFREEQM